MTHILQGDFIKMKKLKTANNYLRDFHDPEVAFLVISSFVEYETL